MTVLDAQLGFKAESTYGTPVTVDKFLEFSTESLRPNYGVMRSNNRRPGQPATRSDRTARTGLRGLTGDVAFQPLSKGPFGTILKQVLGTNSSSIAVDSKYTHTASLTAGNLTDVSLTLQVGRPSTDGTVNPFTYAGVKSAGLTLSNSVDGILEAVWSIGHATAEATGTALATASYSSGAEVFSYVGGALTVDAVSTPITDCSVSFRNAQKLRPFLGNAAGLQPLENGDREVRCSFTAEFASMTLLNKVRSATAAGGQGAIVMTWTAPTLIGAASYPTVVVTIPVVEFEEPSAANVSGAELLMMPMSGMGLYNNSSLITIAYGSADATI